eukprot:PhM_4_TR4675/c0_g2_i1/m.90617
MSLSASSAARAAGGSRRSSGSGALLAPMNLIIEPLGALELLTLRGGAGAMPRTRGSYPAALTMPNHSLRLVSSMCSHSESRSRAIARRPIDSVSRVSTTSSQFSLVPATCCRSTSPLHHAWMTRHASVSSARIRRSSWRCFVYAFIVRCTLRTALSRRTKSRWSTATRRSWPMRQKKAEMTQDASLRSPIVYIPRSARSSDVSVVALTTTAANIRRVRRRRYDRWIVVAAATRRTSLSFSSCCCLRLEPRGLMTAVVMRRLFIDDWSGDRTLLPDPDPPELTLALVVEVLRVPPHGLPRGGERDDDDAFEGLVPLLPRCCCGFCCLEFPLTDRRRAGAFDVAAGGIGGRLPIVATVFLAEVVGCCGGAVGFFCCRERWRCGRWLLTSDLLLFLWQRSHWGLVSLAVLVSLVLI